MRSNSRIHLPRVDPRQSILLFRNVWPALESAGELLGWHPHLPVLLTDGGWLPDGTFRHLLAFDSVPVENLFRAEVLRLLVASGKLSRAVVDNLLTWRHSGFSVHAGVRVEEHSEAVRLGRYGIRCPLVLERLTWDETSGEGVSSLINPTTDSEDDPSGSEAAPGTPEGGRTCH